MCSVESSSLRPRGILQARILTQVAMSFSSRSSRPRSQAQVCCVSCSGRQVLYHGITTSRHCAVFSGLYPITADNKTVREPQCTEEEVGLRVYIFPPRLLHRAGQDPVGIRESLNSDARNKYLASSFSVPCSSSPGSGHTGSFSGSA